MKKCIGIVSEGPTDFILLKGIIDHITQEQNEYIQLQPEDNLIGAYGNGWKGVWKWCNDHAGFLNTYMQGVTPKVELLVIQMDGDVSRKEKEVHCYCQTTECALRGENNPLNCPYIKENECPILLPCSSHEKNINGYITHLTELIHTWIGAYENTCITIPCDSTDAWVVAAYDKLPQTEYINDPWNAVISRAKEYHGIRIPGHKKRGLTYQQFVNCVCTNWDDVKRICISAEQFEAGIKKFL